MKKSCKGILLFYDWLRPMLRLEPAEFKALIEDMYMIQTAGINPDTKPYSREAQLIASLVYPTIRRRRLYYYPEPDAGNPFFGKVEQPPEFRDGDGS